MAVRMKRAYEEVEKNDGMRILVDRIWPRGVSKDKLRLDYWFKDIAPSPSLRKWFAHDPDKFNQFKEHYIDELLKDETKKQKLAELQEIVNTYDTVSLIFGAKDKRNNHATVLIEVLANKSDVI